jgi:hypothetical protein
MNISENNRSLDVKQPSINLYGGMCFDYHKGKNG